MQEGVYVNVPAPEEYVAVSQNTAMMCKRTQAQHWQTTGIVVSGRGYLENKGLRQQLGVAAARVRCSQEAKDA
eukprot:9360251-Lingulodinium_polyedra.AAC.1